MSHEPREERQLEPGRTQLIEPATRGWKAVARRVLRRGAQGRGTLWSLERGYLQKLQTAGWETSFSTPFLAPALRAEVRFSPNVRQIGRGRPP